MTVVSRQQSDDICQIEVRRWSAPQVEDAA